MLKNDNKIDEDTGFGNKSNQEYAIQIKDASKKRDQLNDYLRKNKIDSKIHYPKPLHLHDAAKKLKYSKGQFKNAEKLSKKVISNFP